jgi:hypothetical protein
MRRCQLSETVRVSARAGSLPLRFQSRRADGSVALTPVADEEQQRSLAELLLDASSSGATAGGAGLDAESGAGGDHRRLAGVDGGDDLGVVDAPIGGG